MALHRNLAEDTNVPVKEGEGEEDCRICLEPLTNHGNVKPLKCSHAFHGACLKRWIDQSAESKDGFRCPTCRDTIEQEVVNAEFSSLEHDEQVLSSLHPAAADLPQRRQDLLACLRPVEHEQMFLLEQNQLPDIEPPAIHDTEASGAIDNDD